jgi:autotransporter translocation and assembly factor TamB
MNLSVKADQLYWDEILLDQFELKASGTPENHVGSLKLQAYHTLLESSGKLKLNDKNDIEALLQDLSLTFADESRFVLEKPTQINWVDNALSIHPTLCLSVIASAAKQSTSAACISNTAPQAFKIQITNLPNQLFARYFTDRFRPSGRTDAQADFTLKGLAIQTLNLQGNVSPTEIRRGKKKERTFFEVGGAQFQLSLDPDHLKSSGFIALINPDRLDWNLEVDDWNTLPLATLKASLTGNITRWDPLRLYITDTNDFSGKVNINLTAQGKVLEPTYQGALTLSEARLAIPGQGLTLQDGHLTITPTKSHEQLEIAGGLRSGEGTLTLNGFLSLEDRWPSLDILIKGERFTLSNTASAIVFASPTLRVQTEERMVDVSGELHIPEASLNIKGYSSYIAPSPDIIIIQENGRIFTPFYELNTRVLLSLGDAVSLKASNLDTGVGGQVHLTKLGNAPVRATGQIKGIDGKYAAYGQKINLSQAVLTFNNSLIDNPALFIEASRNIQMASTGSSAYLFADPAPNKSGSVHEGTVGVRITGTVQSPKYTFYSTPPMSEADQLSYLMTGGPSSQIGSAQAAFMFAALTETSGILGVSDTDAARLQNITRTLGIDFNIESGSRIDAGTGQTISDTNLVVGKSIHPRLYVSYTVGLLDPLNMFRVRYQLSRHWAVQSQANSQGDTGGDILYGIETDSFLGIE